MRREAAEAAAVFVRSAVQDVPPPPSMPQSIYTVARGSSDAAACMLWYEYMAVLGIPVTSLPPSVFSLMGGVRMSGAHLLVISQSGGSDDLVRAAAGARAHGAHVTALINADGSPLAAEADCVVPVGAGPERAVPATKSVIGSVAAGMALLAAMDPGYARTCASAAAIFADLGGPLRPDPTLRAALLRAQHVYVIGRGAGYGAAQEVALKLKETCALHAEAYSASEVLHGPLQLTTRPLFALLLDTGSPETQASLDAAEARFREEGSDVLRLRARDLGSGDLAPPAAAALLLNALYPAILETALALGFDPDAPDTLAKVTRTL
ncbi:SIS domain-containing protein [Rhodobacteraceae bacterium CCMM004]|nr:SIS domain-containing protein [Rhodobacteraceae bacterium CCMM004]